jgi:hypothetical protein
MELRFSQKRRYILIRERKLTKTLLYSYIGIILGERGDMPQHPDIPVLQILKPKKEPRKKLTTEPEDFSKSF